MNIDRRTFIKTAGGIALASVVPFARAAGGPPPRVSFLSEPGFPPGEIALPDPAALRTAFAGCDLRFVSLKELPSRLASGEIDLFVNPYGSFFPKEAFTALLGYLKSGGNWLNLGGVPCSLPVLPDGTGWKIETRQTAYHKRLGITQAFPVNTCTSVRAAEGSPLDEEAAKELTVREVQALYFRFTSTKDFPGEDGSGGQRDARVRPLLLGTDSAGRRLAAPIVQIDRLLGEYAGGRWVLAACSGTISARLLRRLADIALVGALELTARTSFACYEEGELPAISIQLRRPKGQIAAAACRVEIQDDRGTTLTRMELRLTTDGTAHATLPGSHRGSLRPGLYRVKVTLPLQEPFAGAVGATTGFWMFDRALLSGGSAFTAGSDFLRKDGRPYPVTGTTYMASDVHRKFLFEPNPAVWEADFASMKASGINMVRTGIWTGWKNLMLDVGAMSEPALRAMDAFLLTARRHEIPVIFTFFAFLPESWGGLNAYLDPRSVSAQKEFVAAFVSRYRGVREVLWDFINEPSFCSPQHLWQCRPNYDAFETAAWTDWLKQRYPFTTDAERAAYLQELYRSTSDEALTLPTLEEFSDVNIFNAARPVKVIDYRLFAQEMFARWTREMAAVVKRHGDQLVTVGQDEGGTGESPSPHFFAETVDFACIHNWWLNDDLVWDNVMSKPPGKANLVEETGVMFYETLEGGAWRSEQEASNLLERKLAVALGAGGAGFIEWVWNTNPYMMSDNEAAIGLHRADGTAKPELDPVERFAAFFKANRHLMTGRRAAPVLMVIPHTGQFSTRNFASEATKRCVRTLSYRFHLPVEAVSEYRLETITSPPALLLVPSPRALARTAWPSLVRLAEAGSTLLVTGPFEADEHWLPAERLSAFGLRANTRPVAQEEFLSIDGVEHRLSFRGNKLQRLEAAVVEGSGASVLLRPVGKGAFLWAPLPVELAESPDPTSALYAFALRRAGVTAEVSTVQPDPPALVLPTLFDEAMLITCVSETSRDIELALRLKGLPAEVTARIPAGRASLFFVRRSNGEIISSL